jgi:GntR family transcriptional regulator
VGIDWTAFEPVHGPVARYRQLAAFVRDAVERGELRPGEPLPSETAIADYTGLSVDTVRSALSMLRDEGVIVTSQGIGSFVAKTPRDT